MGDSHVLEVDMLGGFAAVCDGEAVFLGKNTGAKFLSFLQMLILSGDAGISRQEIIDAFFADDDLANVTNSLNNLVYQSRRQLGRSSLPAGVGIRKVKDRYFWTSPIPTETDVARFTDALRKAQTSDDLRTALALYRGDLLPSVTGNPQIDRTREELRRDYRDAVARLAADYLEQKDTTKLIRLYSDAAEATANGDGALDAALVNALIDAGDAHAALKYYDRALRRYQSQGKGAIPEALEACAERLSAVGITGDSASLKTRLLDVVSVDADEAPTEKDGALYCNYPSFIDAVKLLRRGLLRDPRPVTLMLLTLVDYEGKPLRAEKKQIRYAEDLRASIHGSLRVGDSFTRNDPTGFLVLLPGADEENAVAIFHRISKSLKEKAGSNAAVRYRMLSLNSLDAP